MNRSSVISALGVACLLMLVAPFLGAAIHQATGPLALLVGLVCLVRLVWFWTSR